VQKVGGGKNAAIPFSSKTKGSLILKRIQSLLSSMVRFIFYILIFKIDRQRFVILTILEYAPDSNDTVIDLI